jgi:hypothetical protein
MNPTAGSRIPTGRRRLDYSTASTDLHIGRTGTPPVREADFRPSPLTLLRAWGRVGRGRNRRVKTCDRELSRPRPIGDATSPFNAHFATHSPLWRLTLPLGRKPAARGVQGVGQSIDLRVSSKPRGTRHRNRIEPSQESRFNPLRRLQSAGLSSSNARLRPARRSCW